MKIEILNLDTVFDDQLIEMRQSINERALCGWFSISTETGSVTLFDNISDFIPELYRGCMSMVLQYVRTYELSGWEGPHELTLVLLDNQKVELKIDLTGGGEIETLFFDLVDLLTALHKVMFDLYLHSGLSQNDLPNFYSLNGNGLMEETFGSIRRYL